MKIAIPFKEQYIDLDLEESCYRCKTYSWDDRGTGKEVYREDYKDKAGRSRFRMKDKVCSVCLGKGKLPSEFGRMIMAFMETYYEMKPWDDQN